MGCGGVGGGGCGSCRHGPRMLIGTEVWSAGRIEFDSEWKRMSKMVKIELCRDMHGLWHNDQFCQQFPRYIFSLWIWKYKNYCSCYFFVLHHLYAFLDKTFRVKDPISPKSDLKTQFGVDLGPQSMHIFPQIYKPFYLNLSLYNKVVCVFLSVACIHNSSVFIQGVSAMTTVNLRMNSLGDSKQ